MRYYFLAFSVIFANYSLASTKVLCSGQYQGMPVVLNGHIENITDPKTGKGTIAVDGREVAEFEGGDAKINYIFLTAKIKNSRGELMEGKLIDLAKGAGVITRLSVPGYGIDFKNIPVTCVDIN